MRKLIKVNFIICLFTLFLTVGLTVKAALIITIPERVVINQPWIKMGDIADIKGLTGNKLAEISSINIGKAMLPGYAREIPRGHIILLLKDKGYSQSDFTLDMGESVVVETDSYRISHEEIMSEAKKYILKSWNYPAEKITIRESFIPHNILIPTDDYQLEFSSPGRNSLTGDLSLKLRLIINGEVYRRFYIRLKVTILEEVLIARRRIARGERINKKDLFSETRGISNFKGELISNMDDPLIKNGVVRIPIPENTVLTSEYLSLPVIIKRGDKVFAEVKVGSIKATTMVKARQNGKKGEYITVENLNSGKRFKAEVISSQLVRIEK